MTSEFFNLKSDKMIQLENQFNEWNLNQKQSYHSENEYLYRLKIFSETDDKINQHNSNNSSYQLGHNHFSTLSETEWKNAYLMEPKQISLSKEEIDEIKARKPRPISEWKVSKTKNWYYEKKVSEVKDQGICGSCWAFASTDVLASTYSIKYKPQEKVPNLSPQYLVDCGMNFSMSLRGCLGSDINEEVFKFLQLKGTPTEDEYPYKQKMNFCNSTPNIFIKLDKYREVKGTMENFIQALENGPLFIYVDANFTWKHYKTGRVDFKAPCGLILNHAVMAIGYDIEDEEPYFIIKNSWSEAWGELGFMNMAVQDKSRTGMCGMMSKRVFEMY